MAKMATTPVFGCRGCGKPVAVKLEAKDTETLKQLMTGLAKIALCKYCKARYDYLAYMGRSEEFPLNEHIIIYQVVDNSGLDYYNRKAT